eukprot:TRINITY_DN3701_c0_g1_i1.p1 TRINITY_DN3701_c0_g1~~TRINITY_DN3701_c0_g1_i1.p1  ORF type:complete len:126 (-),score=17.32 TRINITY_DN3701_c0_g1_i1:8-385(-)
MIPSDIHPPIGSSNISSIVKYSRSLWKFNQSFLNSIESLDPLADRLKINNMFSTSPDHERPSFSIGMRDAFVLAKDIATGVVSEEALASILDGVACVCEIGEESDWEVVFTAEATTCVNVLVISD